MYTGIPFSNLSLKKVLDQEPDTLKRARIKIVFVSLVLTLVKIAIALPLVVHGILDHQLYRSLFVFALFAALTKYILYKPQHINLISHCIISSGLMAVWTSLIVFDQQLNLVTVQFAFMVTFIGYYLINSRAAIAYSILAVVPVMYYLFASHDTQWRIDRVPQGLPSPGFEVIVLMNFTTMVYIHYLFYRAFHDNVTEKELLNKQLQATVAETKALAEARSVFLSTMSHELRTPLNAVIGMTHLIKDCATPEQEENLDILEFSANNLLTMVNDVLDFNKSENDKIELEHIPVQLYILLQRVCSGLQFKAAEKGLELILDADDAIRENWVMSDPTRLTQIFYNLIGNAVKFTDKGSVIVKAVSNIAADSRLNVHIEVADSGIGIPIERQATIFDPFVQATTATTRNYGGTGLGLAIVKRLLDLFGSTIQVQSEPGVGSKFSFDIGLKLYEGETRPLSQNAATTGDLDGLNVLIVEDNAVNSLLLAKLLTKWNATIMIAQNGLDAIAKVKEHAFDVVLMDLHMPVMDGYEAARAIRALSDPQKAAVPIIAFTASVSHNVQSKIEAAGMYEHMPKPFQPAMLYNKLEAYNAGRPRKALA